MLISFTAINDIVLDFGHYSSINSILLKRLNRTVFFPPIILLVFTVLLSQLYGDEFVSTLQVANQWILDHFSGLFSWTALLILGLVIVVYFSKLGGWRIGGSDARPILSKWKWFAVTICTTIATGILFWGVAEPIFHFSTPPPNLGITAGSKEAMTFAMSSLMMHWTLTPYAIYTLAGLVFAVSFYNLRQPFSLGSMVSPLFGDQMNPNVSNFIDIVCLYGLVAGMAASLGTGLLSVMGGLDHLLGWSKTSWGLALITGAIVVTFIVSAVSGLMKGIRILSDINIRLFILLALFVFLAGPTWALLELGLSGVSEYAAHMVSRSLNLDNALGQKWFNSWTVFNWANWLAWTPITAVFLGRIARGYTVRTFIIFNLVIPSIFGAAWMMIFGGSALLIDFNQGGVLSESLRANGPESLVYLVLGDLPFAIVVSTVFVVLIFLSYVTAADSNTSAMSALSTSGISLDQIEAPVRIKVIWGVLIGLVAWVMVSSVGIEGIKMTSILGGFPILFFMIAVSMSAVVLMIRSRKVKN